MSNSARIMWFGWEMSEFVEFPTLINSDISIKTGVGAEHKVILGLWEAQIQRFPY